MAEQDQPAAQEQGQDPKQFFEGEVPSSYKKSVSELEGKVKKLTKKLEDLKGAEATIKIVLTGDGGGAWNLNFKNGEISAGEAASEPLITITQTIEDWRKTQNGGVGAQFNMFAPPKSSKPEGSSRDKEKEGRGPRGGLTRGRVEKLKTINGAIRFRITELQEGGEWVLQTKFGTGPAKEQPDCTISVRYPDYEDIASGKMNPQAAFMSGKVRIEGNMGFAMQLGTMIMGG